ncbi:hypothetical protein [Bacteroides reticulotermitis]|uniref:NVEALA protein n=1 Tax=Bacteroides reticulotermitis TaxID=1133319 RepID=A0A840CVB6_9BACE|nr:hypothetical protein [Bacteroides reticulotermitis]MBB4043246.1 hypothetical protein [Bacteroides reticulotermitis]
MKIKLLLLITVVVSTVLFSFSPHRESFDLLLENIESFANDEHGKIDPTLDPYTRLGSKTLSIILDGKIITTTIPCCESDPSPYSGCSRGLDSC